MQFLLTVIIIIIIFLVLYFTFLRSWQLRWGATNDELARPMPGDDIVRDLSFDATRAVTINSPPGGYISVDRTNGHQPGGLVQL